MSRDALEDLRTWAREAKEKLRPLPPSVYVSPELLRLEIENLFYREWICIGHISELSEPGEYLTFDIVDKQLLVLCDKDTAIRAFENVCLHRGALLAQGAGRKKVFTCPYHAWSYSLDGTVINTPHIDYGRPQGLCLAEYQTEIWQGLIFVNIDRNAKPLAPKLSPLEARVCSYDFRQYRVVHRSEQQVACNWKVLVENFCESYHLFCVHKNTLEPETPTTTTEVQPGGDGFNHHTMTMISADSKEHLFCVYPCTVLTNNARSLLWLTIRPIGPQTLKYIVQLAMLPDENGEISQESIDKRVNEINSFMEEDKSTIESVQLGLASQPDLSGFLHPFERTNWEFGHYLARKLLGLTQK